MKRIKLSLEVHGFDDYVTRLDELGANVKEIVSDIYEQCTDDITADTIAAVKNIKKLPAGGKYSTGDTLKSIIKAPKMEWSGEIGEIGVGFDHSKNGAGLLLITGTPRMKPVLDLEDIYARKKPIKKFNIDVTEAFERAIKEIMEG